MEICYLQYAVVAFIAMIYTIISQSDGRELRPSEHGLLYQESSPPMKANGTQQMRNFFGATSASSMSLPEAKNFSDPATWWSNHAAGRSRGDHVKGTLLIASLICGLAGVILLSVAGIVVLLRLRKQKQQKLGSSSVPISAPNALVLK